MSVVLNRKIFEKIYKDELNKMEHYLLTLDLSDINIINPIQNGDYSYECDKNYKKRLEIVVILFLSYNMNDKKYEMLAEKLFLIEMKRTKKEQSSATYATLMLTSLLLITNKDHIYNNLFEEYKNLNYDTYCGYSIGYCESDYPYKSIEDYTQEELLDFLLYIDCENLALKLMNY